MRVCMCAVAWLLCGAVASAQDRPWRAEVTVGWAGFVDDSTQNYLLIGGSVRRQLTPRLSIGPEIVVMRNADLSRDLNLMVTGNVVYDFVATTSDRRVTPFVVGGLGIFRGRDQVRNGPFWFSDPAFTAGAGVRARITEAVSAGGEYRLGWEPHQRISGALSVAW